MDTSTTIELNIIIIVIFTIIYWSIDYFNHNTYTNPMESLYQSITCHMPYTKNEYKNKCTMSRIATFSHNTIVQCLVTYNFFMI